MISNTAQAVSSAARVLFRDSCGGFFHCDTLPMPMNSIFLKLQSQHENKNLCFFISLCTVFSVVLDPFDL